MANSIAVLTAIAGGYDHLIPQPAQTGADLIAFIDDETPAPADIGWEIRPLNGIPSFYAPRLRAKWPKVMATELLREYEFTIWIDANHTLLHRGVAAAVVEAMGDAAWALHRHPWRDDILDEAEASLEYPKYAGQPLLPQANSYCDHGYQRHSGLWAGGTIARRRSDPTVALAWWGEITRWSIQDQISLPWVLQQYRVPVATLPWAQYENPHILVGGHAKDWRS